MQFVASVLLLLMLAHHHYQNWFCMYPCISNYTILFYFNLVLTRTLEIFLIEENLPLSYNIYVNDQGQDQNLEESGKNNSSTMWHTRVYMCIYILLSNAFFFI